MAEGAYNLVMRYQGAHAALQGLVLRCAKRNVRPGDPRVALADAAAFSDGVMAPLLGRRYVPPAGGGAAARPPAGAGGRAPLPRTSQLPSSPLGGGYRLRISS